MSFTLTLLSPQSIVIVFHCSLSFVHSHYKRGFYNNAAYAVSLPQKEWITTFSTPLWKGKRRFLATRFYAPYPQSAKKLKANKPLRFLDTKKPLSQSIPFALMYSNYYKRESTCAPSAQRDNSLFASFKSYAHKTQICLTIFRNPFWKKEALSNNQKGTFQTWQASKSVNRHLTCLFKTLHQVPFLCARRIRYLLNLTSLKECEVHTSHASLKRLLSSLCPCY